MATNYFTKQVETEALVNIYDVNAKKFVQKNIMTQFGVPEALILDNGLQFDSKAFRKYCSDIGIKNRYSALAYPQSNGQAEATNKTIVNELKKRLETDKGKWTEELPDVLQAYQNTPRRSLGETSFSMTYGTKAVIPVEAGLPSMRTMCIFLNENDQLMTKQLDFMEDNREIASVHLVDYQWKLSRRYNRNFRPREFVARNLVLRRVLGSIKELSLGKLA